MHGELQEYAWPGGRWCGLMARAMYRISRAPSADCDALACFRPAVVKTMMAELTPYRVLRTLCRLTSSVSGVPAKCWKGSEPGSVQPSQSRSLPDRAKAHNLLGAKPCGKGRGMDIQENLLRKP